MPQTPAERRQAILDQVRGSGYVRAVDLSSALHVDSSTIRRDMERLERAGLIRRMHGGALPADPADTIDTPWEVRRSQHLAEKTAIGEAAAALVEDGQTVLIDNGSTAHQVAAALSDHRGLTVVTNDLMVALCLRSQGVHQVHVTGGLLLDTVFTLVGPIATQAVESMHVDWAFLGAEGVEPEAGITNINVVEIPLKRAMLAAAQNAAVVADSSKFGRRSLATVCTLDDLDAVITDDGVPLEDRGAYGATLRCVPVAR
ncbi:DeoR/GlpR family DNA-binding transcription regulator [Curtobacterium sp. VKM Ac-1376]|uniref:DeoR/GlpR family DNA-binding transcription regulator n=1 Tax=Curtobacterium sp. VKM Ac-1376 TaxID=123312 RepID=UPI00188CAF7F|nr:DeoR/GlpR family DNA-binding transcription regulator [Curtobacterium sp. VKM Ac-1376]MBF4612960.1 DeoR/GlpR transcriptional regulator [Curtobacterium sp. VKM Ac-1376]